MGIWEERNKVVVRSLAKGMILADPKRVIRKLEGDGYPNELDEALRTELTNQILIKVKDDEIAVEDLRFVVAHDEKINIDALIKELPDGQLSSS